MKILKPRRNQVSLHGVKSKSSLFLLLVYLTMYSLCHINLELIASCDGYLASRSYRTDSNVFVSLNRCR